MYKAYLLPKAGDKVSSYSSAMPDTVAVKTLKGIFVSNAIDPKSGMRILEPMQATKLGLRK